MAERLIVVYTPYATGLFVVDRDHIVSCPSAFKRYFRKFTMHELINVAVAKRWLLQISKAAEVIL